MKTFSSLRRASALATVGLVGLFAPATPGWAAGGALGGANVGAAGGVGNGGGVAVGGGGRSGAVGGGRAASVGVSPGQHLGSGFGQSVGPARLGSAGGSLSPNASVGGGRLGNPGVGNRMVSPNFNNLSRPVFGNGRVGSPGILNNPGAVPSISRHFDGAATPRLATPRYTNAQGIYRSVAPVRANNAWTDSRTSRLAPAARVNQFGTSRAYDPGQNYLQGRLTPGQHLYPGASNYSAITAANNHAWQGDRGGYRHPFRYNRYYDAGLYTPFLYTGIFPVYYGAFGGYGDYTGLGSTYSTDITTDQLNNGLVNPASGPGYYSGQDQGYAAPQPAQQGTPDFSLTPPAQVGPESPDAAAPAPSPAQENGPDSLVEAVQAELARRGYYPGKVEGIYGDSTRAAIRQFQRDRQLAVTGRINEATLHALQLD